MKCDLRDTAFLLIARFDTTVRLENALCVIEFLCTHFDAHIFLWEFDSHNNGIFERVKPLSVEYRFHEDWDPVLHRTRHINNMLQHVDERFVAVWDVDVIAPIEQIVESVNCLREGLDFVYPYACHFCDTSEEIRNMFVGQPDINLLLRHQKFMNESLNNKINKSDINSNNDIYNNNKENK